VTIPSLRTVTVQGIEVPTFLYGTAWKEERTSALVEAALAAGFRGIDTANQRKHYHEAGVGRGLAAAEAAGGPPRGALFLQTKYTYAEGQDVRLPYDQHADFATQVRQSLASSLGHLGIPRVDSFVLHGPRAWSGLTTADREVWRAMEDLQRAGRTRLLGVSNVSASQLALLCEIAQVRPAFVQNRCFAQGGWDREVRAVCARQGVVYQAFSLLTANPAVLAHKSVTRLAARRKCTPAQVIFRFALQLGMICLTGTSDPDHMRQDLAAQTELALTEGDVAAIERLAG
jgi:diketogulonate reductase-like aldo/keto reductase